jgi:hypothetical protein
MGLLLALAGAALALLRLRPQWVPAPLLQRLRPWLDRHGLVPSGPAAAPPQA